MLDGVSPAPAGMILTETTYDEQWISEPRTRGDDPRAVRSLDVHFE